MGDYQRRVTRKEPSVLAHLSKFKKGEAMGWNEHKIERLKQLWAEGVTASAIAADLGGITKNAVIGKAGRLGLEARRLAPVKRSADEKRQFDRERHEKWRRSKGILPLGFTQRKPRQSAPPLAPVIVSLEDEKIPAEQRLQLFDLENHTCRWPVGEPGQPGFFFCGAPEADHLRGRSYCKAHTLRACNHSARVLEAA